MLPKRLVYKVRMGQWTVARVVFLYSDTSANEDNSFRNHIR